MYLFAGAGPSYAAAVVGAAKTKECTPDHAIAVHSRSSTTTTRRRPVNRCGCWSPSGRAIERGVDTIQEAHRLGGHVYAITTEGEQRSTGEAAAW